MKKLKNEDLGYNTFFESNHQERGLGEFSVARVISESRGVYKIKNADGEYLAKITGKQMLEASSREDYPAVGDWITIEELNDKQAIIRNILPRATIIKRKYGDRNKLEQKVETQIIATNIDVAFVVESVDRDYSLNRLERYLVIARNGGVEPVIVLNKVDLISKEELDEKLTEIKNRIPDTMVLLTSTVDDNGIYDFKKYIEKGTTYCFLGSSGVGKSSLVNKLLEKDLVKTGNIGSHSGKGKHTTTSRQMYFLENGGIVIDNPGIREVGLANVSEEIDSFPDEIAALSLECKYTDCTHTNEPGCRVRTAIESGELEEEKYSNYIGLKKEAEYHGATDMEKKEKDRQFGKFIKRAKKEFKKNKHKNY